MANHLISHRVVVLRSPKNSSDSIGGRAVLPAGMAYPHCSCGERMVLFFQFGLPGSFGLPFAFSSHLAVFMCPKHNEAPEPVELPLRDKFWNRRDIIGGSEQFYQIVLHVRARSDLAHDADPYLIGRPLGFVKFDEKSQNDGDVLIPEDEFPGVSLSVEEWKLGEPMFKVGGQPSWAQEPVVPTCSCGSKMVFICQCPVNYPFKKVAEAPEQPYGFSREDYGLFLGNETYLFGCRSQCHPLAVVPIVQN